MKKILLITLISIWATGSINAQKIKLKKGIVNIDDTECMKYDSSPNNAEFTSNDGKQTIILKFIRTGVGSNGGLYTKIIFLEQKLSLTSKSYIFNKKNLIKKLLTDGVLSDCVIDVSKIQKFVMKYDEGI